MHAACYWAEPRFRWFASLSKCVLSVSWDGPAGGVCTMMERRKWFVAEDALLPDHAWL